MSGEPTVPNETISRPESARADGPSIAPENPEQARKRLVMEQRARGISRAMGPTAGLNELAKGNGNDAWGTPEPEGTTATSEPPSAPAEAGKLATEATTGDDAGAAPETGAEAATATPQEPQEAQQPSGLDAEIAKARADLQAAKASGDQEVIDRATNKLLELHTKSQQASAELEDASPLEERLDEARHQIEELNRLIKEAQRIGDTESIGKLQLEQQSIAGRYTSLLGNADEKFRERYLEKIEKEKEKKEKGPLWKRLLRILRDSLVVGSGSVVSSVGSDLKDAAEGPPKR